MERQKGDEQRRRRRRGRGRRKRGPGQTRGRSSRKLSWIFHRSGVERDRGTHLMGALIPSSRMYRRIGRWYRSCAPYAIDGSYYRMYGRHGGTSSRIVVLPAHASDNVHTRRPPSLPSPVVHSSLPLVIPTNINFTVEHWWMSRFRREPGYHGKGRIERLNRVPTRYCPRQLIGVSIVK